MNIVTKLFILAASLGILLWHPINSHWFNFYGYSLFLIAVLVSVLWYLKKQLSKEKKIRLWLYIISLILGLSSFLQIIFWFLFFHAGQTNPQLGLFREMLRPLLETFGSYLFAVLLIVWFFIVAHVFIRAAATEGFDSKN